MKYIMIEEIGVLLLKNYKSTNLFIDLLLENSVKFIETVSFISPSICLLFSIYVVV
jgi:hypothetical protein